MFQDGFDHVEKRGNNCSAAEIQGDKRKLMIFVGNYIVRKTESRLDKDEDIAVCLPGENRTRHRKYRI